MNHRISWQKILCWVTLYSIAMGYLESAVIIYLRTLYYPNGFAFPLSPMSTSIALTELIREAATIIMLVSIGYIAGRNFPQRFAYFLYSFAVWDIFYYIFLKLIANWPASFMTWDILFLIPVCWISPVIAPIIVSFTMIILSLIVIIGEEKNVKIKIDKISWNLLIIGSVIIILSFIWDFSGYVHKHFSLTQMLNMTNKDVVPKTAFNYIPRNFNWSFFMTGEIVILLAIVSIARPFLKNK